MTDLQPLFDHAASTARKLCSDVAELLGWDRRSIDRVAFGLGSGLDPLDATARACLPSMGFGARAIELRSGPGDRMCVAAEGRDLLGEMAVPPGLREIEARHQLELIDLMSHVALHCHAALLRDKASAVERVMLSELEELIADIDMLEAAVDVSPLGGDVVFDALHDLFAGLVRWAASAGRMSQGDLARLMAFQQSCGAPWAIAERHRR